MPDSPLSSTRIAPGAHVTLHYRIAAVIEGVEREVMTTFAGHPATLTIGVGDLAEPLEARLLGLAAGECAAFELAADEGFGSRKPELVRSLSHSTFEASVARDNDYAPGDVVELSDGDGHRYSGVLTGLDADGVRIDFNHPLAGHPVRFSVQIVGVL